jgi:hypothetical protein
MSRTRTADPSLLIPPPPRKAAARRRPLRQTIRDALTEASVVGMLALAASWGLAELALLLLGGPD